MAEKKEQLKRELLRLLETYTLEEIAVGMAELCEADAERYEKEGDDSGIVGSCRSDAEALREAAEALRRD